MQVHILPPVPQATMSSYFQTVDINHQTMDLLVDDEKVEIINLAQPGAIYCHWCDGMRHRTQALRVDTPILIHNKIKDLLEYMIIPFHFCNYSEYRSHLNTIKFTHPQ